MTSADRHDARFHRRQIKRLEKKAERNDGYTFENCTSFGALLRSFYKCRKGTNWKASVQKYGCNVMRNSYVISHKLRKHQNISKGFVEFDLNERGKRRHIMSVHISERVPQKAVCDYGIVPVMERSLIYENGASQKGKGTDFSTKQLIKDLREHYKKVGSNNGYILLGDGHDYFGSLRHEEVKKVMSDMLTDQELVDLAMTFITPFRKGLGLGSQICQINAVAYADSIDHYIKEVLKVKYYCRYMDDWNIIVDTKEEAERLLAIIEKLYADKGIKMNRNKTLICRLSSGFVWLQDRYRVTETGRIIRRAPRKRIKANMRKLVKLAKKVEGGSLDLESARCFWVSIDGYLRLKTEPKTKKAWADLYNSLFINQGGMRCSYY